MLVRPRREAAVGAGNDDAFDARVDAAALPEEWKKEVYALGDFNASPAPVLRDLRDPARADDNLFAASAFPLRGRAMGSRLVRVATKQVLILWIME